MLCRLKCEMNDILVLEWNSYMRADSGRVVRERTPHTAHNFRLADGPRMDRRRGASRSRRVARQSARTARGVRTQREPVAHRLLYVRQRAAACGRAGGRLGVGDGAPRAGRLLCRRSPLHRAARTRAAHAVAAAPPTRAGATRCGPLSALLLCVTISD